MSDDRTFSPLDLTRTRAALRAYDAALPEFQRRWDAMENNDEFYALMKDMQAASAPVGEAFADDSAEWNSRSAARMMQPCHIDFVHREFNPCFDTSRLWAWFERGEKKSSG